MNKEKENICEEIYDYVKKYPITGAASELSQIVHMSKYFSKEDIIARCVAIRNALWDLEEEKWFIFKAESEIKQEEIKTKEALGAME